MDHTLFSLNINEAQRDSNDNLQMFNIDIKVEKDSETNEDWSVENFGAGNLLKPLFFKQVAEKQCLLCFKYFLDQYDIYKHNLTHLQVTIVNPRFIRCDICGSYFDNIKAIERHMPTHNNSITKTLSYKPKSCKSKTKEYETKTSTISNYKNIKTDLQKNKTKKLHQCEKCHKTYSYTTWHSHMSDVHGTGEFICSICDLVFKCQRYLNRHLQKHIGKEKPKGSMPVEVKCDQCDAVLQSLYALTTHRRNVHSGERFECHICKSKLKCKSYLRAHMRRVHSDGKKHECECGKKFKTHRYLMVHKRNAHINKKKNKLKTVVILEEP